MIVRKATPADSASIAPLLLLAMEEIVYKFIGRNDRLEAEAFLLYFVEKANNQYSWQNCWVAKAEGEVVAAVNVYDGSKLPMLREPVLEHIKQRYNTHVTPEDETSAGEYYIDSLGVHPACRCRGIGTKILTYLIEHYVHQQRCVLGLLVDEENPAAKKLYLRLGFKRVGRKTLLGKKMEHLQIGYSTT